MSKTTLVSTPLVFAIVYAVVTQALPLKSVDCICRASEHERNRASTDKGVMTDKCRRNQRDEHPRDKEDEQDSRT